MTLQDIFSLRAQKEDEKVELLNLEKEKAAMVELLAAVRSQKEKEQVMIVIRGRVGIHLVNCPT